MAKDELPVLDRKALDNFAKKHGSGTWLGAKTL